MGRKFGPRNKRIGPRNKKKTCMKEFVETVMRQVNCKTGARIHRKRKK